MISCLLGPTEFDHRVEATAGHNHLDIARNPPMKVIDVLKVPIALHIFLIMQKKKKYLKA